MSAVAKVIAHYGNLISEDRKLLIVLVTDESGDDGDYVEEARQAAVAREVPIYVIGRQALFGFKKPRSPTTSTPSPRTYWVHIRPGARDRRRRGAPVGRPPQPMGRAALRLRPLRARPPGQGHRRDLLPPAQRGGDLRTHKREKAYSIKPPSRNTSPTTRAATAYAERSRLELRVPPDPLRDHPGDPEVPLPPLLPGLPRPDARGRSRRNSPGSSRAAQHPDRHREAAPRAGEAPQPRAREALAGRLRPDAGPDRRLSDQGLRVPGLPPGDAGQAPQGLEDAHARDSGRPGGSTTRTR